MTPPSPPEVRILLVADLVIVTAAIDIVVAGKAPEILVLPRRADKDIAQHRAANALDVDQNILIAIGVGRDARDPRKRLTVTPPGPSSNA